MGPVRATIELASHYLAATKLAIVEKRVRKHNTFRRNIRGNRVH
jgi:hypothetical protein